MHAPRLPSKLQLALWATPGADTWRGPSHGIVGSFNPEGFSFKALVREPEARENRNATIVREPEARENRNATIDASAFRRTIPPVPVLLFGVTTLRLI